jgi:hypothetical protein
MRKALKAFSAIDKRIIERNKELRRQRFFKCQDTDDNGRIISFGVYDGDTKKYVVFETINFSGNFRYDAQTVPAEVREMEQLIEAD